MGLIFFRLSLPRCSLYDLCYRHAPKTESRANTNSNTEKDQISFQTNLLPFQQEEPSEDTWTKPTVHFPCMSSLQIASGLDLQTSCNHISSGSTSHSKHDTKTSLVLFFTVYLTMLFDALRSSIHENYKFSNNSPHNTNNLLLELNNLLLMLSLSFSCIFMFYSIILSLKEHFQITRFFGT